MALFKSNIRSRVMAHINAKIETAEKQHQADIENAYNEYLSTVSDAAVIRENKKKTSEDKLVNTILN